MPNNWTNPVPTGRPLHLHELGGGSAVATKDASQTTSTWFNPYQPGVLIPPPMLGTLDLSGLQDLINALNNSAVCVCP